MKLFHIFHIFSEKLELNLEAISFKQGLYHKEELLLIKIIDFTTEWLSFQMRPLEGAHSIVYIKLPCFLQFQCQI